MTSQELMIGDWIKFSEAADWANGLNGKPVQVEGLRDDDGAIKVYDPRPDSKFRDFWSDDENDFEPIPITKEILEKNGFEKDARNESYYKWNWYILQDNVSYDMETGIVRLFKTSDLTFCHPIGYVHELQHALRLCEIDKEIVL